MTIDLMSMTLTILINTLETSYPLQLYNQFFNWDSKYQFQDKGASLVLLSSPIFGIVQHGQSNRLYCAPFLHELLHVFG